MCGVWFIVYGVWFIGKNKKKELNALFYTPKLLNF